MLSNRQCGLGPKSGPFTQYEKCKISNRYIPNKREKNLIKLGTKIFCGTFSRDGNHLVTASQGK